GISDLGTPFAKFHLQTSPASGLKTLAKNPGRVLNVIKTNRDENAQVNPGRSAKYRSSIPSMSTARALADPLHYFSNIGPLGALNSPYGTLSQLQQGKVGGVIADTAGRFIPGSQELSALFNLA